MIHVNFIISLIKYVEKIKPCNFTLLLKHRKLCLCVKSQTFCVNTKSIKQVNLELDNDKAKENNDIEESCDTKNSMIQNKQRNNEYIKNYVDNTDPLFAKVCPNKYIRYQNKSADTLYLFEEKTAEKFVELIIDDLSKNTTYVAEVNPGRGILTEKLLQAGITKIHAYEQHECFHPALRKLKNQYPNKLEVIKLNLFKMSKLHYMDCQDHQERVKTVFKNIKPMSWSDKSCMQVIGAITDFVFLKHLILCVVFQSCFMLPGRTCFYLAMPPSCWNVITTPQTHGRMHCRYILFQTLFDYKCLGELNRLSFVPWQRRNLSRSYVAKTYDHEILYLVKLEPKANLFTDYLEPRHLIPYWYFVKHHFTSKKRRVIPNMEKWIPECGIRLIAKDYNIFTQFVDLKPNEVLNLFKEFTSWPEYESSLFTSCVNTHIQAMNQNSSVHSVYNNDSD